MTHYHKYTLKLSLLFLFYTASAWGNNDTLKLEAGIYFELPEINKNTVISGAGRDQTIICNLQKLKGDWNPIKINGTDAYYYQFNSGMDVIQVLKGRSLLNLEELDLARWPNRESISPFITDVSKVNDYYFEGFDGQDGTAPPGGMAWISNSEIESLPDVSGALLWYSNYLRWGSHTEVVSSNEGDRLNFRHTNSGGTNAAKSTLATQDANFVLFKHIALLDTEKEWYYDQDNSRLYLITENNKVPQDIYIRKALSMLPSASYHYLSIVANKITLEGNQSLNSCNILHAMPFFKSEMWKVEPGILLQFGNNKVQACEIADSWGTGLMAYGSNNAGNTKNSKNDIIENNLIHRTNFLGCTGGGITLRGERLLVKNNTIFDTGRSGIRAPGTFHTIFDGNHIYHYGKNSNDLGGIKAGKNLEEYNVYTHNYIHDNTPGSHGKGIYLDVYSGHSRVHHNVVQNLYNGIGFNGEVIGNEAIHNTCVSSGKNWFNRYFQSVGKFYTDVKAIWLTVPP